MTSPGLHPHLGTGLSVLALVVAATLSLAAHGRVSPVPTPDSRPPTPDSQLPTPEPVTYLFSYFTGNGEDGLHFARSEDGTRWRRVADGRSFLAPAVGTKLMRDPSVTRGPDGQYHLVWTTGWWDHAAEYLVVWASTIRDRFPETVLGGDEQQGGRLDHRLYVTTTKDFVTWTPARLFYEGGFSVIDGVLVSDGDRAVLVMKDETRYPQARKHLKVATAAGMAGPYGPASPAFSPDWVEGPTILRLGDAWRIYYDEYTRKRYGAMDTRDFRTFTPVADVVFPDGMRHGTAFAVPGPIAEGLER